jgi:hypothetical protein
MTFSGLFWHENCVFCTEGRIKPRGGQISGASFSAFRIILVLYGIMVLGYAAFVKRLADAGID